MIEPTAGGLGFEGSVPSIAPRRLKPELTTPDTSLSRACAQNTFTAFPNHDFCISSRWPQIPHASWIGLRYLLLGLHDASLPRHLDLRSPRVGRAINYTPEAKAASSGFERVSLALAMFPASPLITFVPPYPGIPTERYDSPNSSASCFIDGTRGAFDGRNYPQLYERRSPWKIFHDNHISRDWDQETCENLPPAHFFRWNLPGNPALGGNWFLTRAGCLLSQREQEESRFSCLLDESAGLGNLLQEGDLLWKFNHPKDWHSTFNMPYYDPLEWDIIEGWITWGEGCDSIAFTLQYVAELKALNRWLTFMIEWKRNPRPLGQYPIPNGQLMGAWSPTIRTKEDWEMVMQSGAPIYIVTRVPKSHPIYSQLVPGNPDGDERYRTNSFDAEHTLTPYWLSRHAYEHIGIPDWELQCRAEYILSNLYPVTPPTLPPNAKSTSYLYTWRVPIYLDNTVEHFRLDSLDSQRNQTEFRRTMDDLFPVISSLYRILKVETDRHPLLDIITSARDNRLSRWEELYDEEKDAYFPRWLGHHTPAARDRMDNCMYCWTYPNERIEISSDFPFPGRPALFGRVNRGPEDFSDNDEGVDNTVDRKARRYFGPGYHSRPGSYAFTWEPYLEPTWDEWQHIRSDIARTSTAKRERSRQALHQFSLQIQRIHVYDDPVREAVQERRHLDGTPVNPLTLPRHEPTLHMDYAKQLVSNEQTSYRDLKILQWRCRYVVLQEKEEEVEEIPEAEIDVQVHDLQQRVTRLETQREDLRVQLQRRLFKPVKGDTAVSEQVVPWRITNGSPNEICYPIRVSGFHGGASNESIFAMLNELFDVFPHEVVLFSECVEVDTTRTLEFGMRYCEDALWIPALLHGVRVDDRLLEVRFLYWISGLIKAITYPLVVPKEEI